MAGEDGEMTLEDFETALYDLLQITDACLNMRDFEDRMVDFTEVDGLTVSTAWTDDCGFETAICDDDHAYPVERYFSRDEAVEGHAKWCRDIVGKATIIQLGYGHTLGKTVIELKRITGIDES